MKTPLCKSASDQELGHRFEWTRQQLGSAEATLLVTQLLGYTFTELHTQPDRLLSQVQVEQLKNAVVRRRRGEPIAYIVGTKMFRDLNLKVSPDVLIPRFETEFLVDLVTQLTPDAGRILDLGTGSGAIAIALSKINQYQVVAVDNDAQALAVCAENSALHRSSVQIVQSNWYENVEGTFDTIVSNPPYIASHDPHLEHGDLRFEPQNALVAGSSGMENLETIVRFAPRFLCSGGWVVVEHGHDQHEAVMSLFESCGYVQIQYCRDFADIPRYVWGQWDGR